MSEHDLKIPSSYSRIIARMLELQERDLPRLLSGTELPVSILLPGDETPISSEQQVQVVANGHRLMGSAGFGLALGHQLGPASHGPVGYLSLSSPDLLGALTAYADFIPVRLPFIQLDIELNGDWLECSYRVLIDMPEYLRQSMAESFAMSVQAIVEEILRREAIEAEIGFRHDTPEYADLYVTFLHGHWSYGQDRTYYRLPARMAYVPNSAGDSEAFRVTRELCNALLKQQPQEMHSISDRVRTLLLTKPQSAVTEEEVARAMFVSKRTLARRLQQEGTGYRQIRDQVLYELASQFLMNTDQSVESISASLGYHDSAAFRKAFRRWTDKNPAEYRAGSR